MTRQYTTVWKFLKKALQHLWILIWGIGWSLFGNLARIRDNFLSEAWKQRLGTRHIMESIPPMNWQGWLIGIFILLIIAIVRSAILQIRAAEDNYFDAQDQLIRLKGTPLSIDFEIHDVVHRADSRNGQYMNRDIFLQVSADLLSPQHVEVKYELAVILLRKTVVANWLRDIDSWCCTERTMGLSSFERSGHKPRYNIDELNPQLEMRRKIDGWLHFRMTFLPDGEMSKCKLRLLASSDYGASHHDLPEGSFQVIPGKRLIQPKAT